ncbi:MAG: hypothetical protein JSR95_15330, partial [Proteobacteria bacterium]|nr:hypothetical protein [Pseudomonadota bacterium]
MNRYVEFLQAELAPYFASGDRKPLRQQWHEMRALQARYHSIAYHYFKHRLYERSARPDFVGYLPANLVQHFRRTYNPPSHMRMLDDKRATIQVLKGTGVRCVETLFSVDAAGAVLQGDGAVVDAGTAAVALQSLGG